jgi:adenosylmethionine-8-amino-7-oxononanoate aminotransferase
MSDWTARDLRVSWHPYTQMSLLAGDPPLFIERAEGLRLFDAGGRAYYDVTSSWWCNVHGHCRRELMEAASRQMARLDHVLFGGATHQPAVELAERLVALAPPGLARVFYSDDGSTAVEVALKMAVQFWRNSGRPEKRRFIRLDRGYHGDTAGCMSVSGVETFRRAFAPLLFESSQAPAPTCYRCPLSLERKTCGARCLELLARVLDGHAGEAAALVLEPLLMGAGGMIVYPPEYLAGAADLARRRDVLLILDEAATGFGRTGTMFACEQAGVSPDMMCVAKGLTGGVMPLAATLVTEKVYEAFLGPRGSERTFYHGHTFTANPVGCAVALASLDLFERDGLMERVRDLAPRLADGFRAFAHLPRVGDVRHIGVVAALELVEDRGTKEPLAASHPVLGEVRRRGLEEGLLLRPLGNVVYVFLPPATTRPELDDVLARLSVALRGAL